MEKRERRIRMRPLTFDPLLSPVYPEKRRSGRIKKAVTRISYAATVCNGITSPSRRNRKNGISGRSFVFSEILLQHSYEPTHRKLGAGRQFPLAFMHELFSAVGRMHGNLETPEFVLPQDTRHVQEYDRIGSEQRPHRYDIA